MTRATPYSAFPNTFRQDVVARKRLIGCWSQLGSPITTEVLGLAGFDWILLDSEHGPNDPLSCVPQLMALKDSPSAPVVRPHSNDGVVVKRLLDIGFFNVIFPCVQSAGEARRAVASTRYPPEGTRGVAVAHRSSRYGTVENYLDLVNDNITVIVQIESRYMDMGATVVAVGSDLGVFRAGTKGLRELFRQDGAREARA